MIKVFISQPMKGKSDEEIKLTRSIIERIVQKKLNNEADIIDSYFEDYPCAKGHKNIALKYLAKSIDKLADADVFFHLTDAGCNRGCAIEERCADYYGIICHMLTMKEIKENATKEERKRLIQLQAESSINLRVERELEEEHE